jgi:DinB superfamily
MSSSQLDTLRWQFGLAWKLAGLHVPALTDQSCLWEPAPGCWTVRQSKDGRWRPDWADVEPDPPPSTTIGWLTWHLIWWWSGLLAAIRGETPAAHHEVDWPGSADAVVRRLEALSSEWSDVLSRLDDGDLERPLAYPWREPRPLRLALAWANSELMKNVAEIGYVGLLFEASRERR